MAKATGPKAKKTTAAKKMKPRKVIAAVAGVLASRALYRRRAL
jgi:hypothetical protein